MKDLQFSNIANNEATLLIYKHIGFDADLGQGVDGLAFANEIIFLNEQYPTLNKIKVRINSPGGSVQEGYSICSAILNSTIPVETIIDGMAYSMAGVIAMCGHTKKMCDYGTFMMHNVSGGDNEEVINLLTNSLAQIFDGNSSLSLEKCKELMNKETWLCAEECAEIGLINEVVKTGKKKPLVMKANKLHALYMNLINDKPKQIKMNKLTSLLKLNNSADEEAIVSAVEEIKEGAEAAKTEAETLKEENEALKAKLKAFEDMEAEKEAASKTEVVEGAIEEGKITNESKEEWINSPLKADKLKNLFASLKTTPTHTQIFDIKNVVADKNSRENWTYRDWEKKDSKGLLEMKNNSPEQYKELVQTLNTIK